MICPECNAEMLKTHGDYQYIESGLPFVRLMNWPLFRCQKNSEHQMALLPDPDWMNVKIVSQLVLHPRRLCAPSIRYLRETLCLTGDQLAGHLRVDVREIWRWQTGVEISGINDLRLRLLAIDHLIPIPQAKDLRAAVTSIFQNSFPELTKAKATTIEIQPDSGVLNAKVLLSDLAAFEAQHVQDIPS